jgi:UDP-N-acetylmuramate--alanine ligase
MQVKKPSPAAVPLGKMRVHLGNGVDRVHVVGVAGSGLRALVQLLHERGFKVTGSELLESPVLETFRLRGIDCRVGHSSGNVDQGTNLVLISAAVNDSNPEVKAALDRRIPVVKYSECLGELMAEKSGIAVAGTHGKTTTTAMVAFILSEAGLDPTFVIGGEHPGLGGSARWGTGHHFVAEACEFDRSFLNLRPRMSIVTNIEEDHLDYFESLKDIQGAFADFVSLLPEDGHLVINRDDPHSAYLSEFCRSAVATFSLRPGAADWWAEDIDAGESGTAFVLAHKDERARVTLRVPGVHNIQNSLAAAAVARRAGVPLERIAQALSAFTGVRRRFDVLARGRIVVVDDYAHHPTEVQSVYRAARQRLPGRRLVAVFQPHQHSRLRWFQKEFAGALARFDASIVTDVFSARDREEDKSVQSDSLAGAILAADPRASTVHAPSFDDVLLALRARVADGDAVIFMGAGSITDLARTYALEVQGD